MYKRKKLNIWLISELPQRFKPKIDVKLIHIPSFHNLLFKLNQLYDNNGIVHYVLKDVVLLDIQKINTVFQLGLEKGRVQKKLGTI